MHCQQTLRNKIELTGTEPYGGCKVELTILPDDPDTGIKFIKDGLEAEVKAELDNIEPTKFFSLLTSIRFEKNGVKVLGAEHLLPTLFVYGVDNAKIKVKRTPSGSFRVLKKLGLATDTEIAPYLPNLQKTLCEAIERVGLEEQNAERKIIRLTEKIDTGKLIIRPIEEDDLIVKAITNYHLTSGERMIQEKEIKLIPDQYMLISTARAYCKVPLRIPRWLAKAAGCVIYPHFGFGYDLNESRIFPPVKSKTEWLLSQKMAAEVACHTIIDRTCEIFTLLGRRPAGIHLTCNGAGHAHAIETMRKYRDKFIESEK